MQVRHDTSLLEKAIEHAVLRASIPTLQAQAEALEKTNRAVAIKRFATGAAIALVAVGLGLGIKFALDRHPASALSMPQTEAQIHNPAPVRPSPEPTMAPPAPPQQEASVSKADRLGLPTSPTTTNFTKFSSRDVDLLGRRWTVTAGHHYANETDKSWQAAWCYTQADVNGVEVKVELADRRTPGATPIAPTAKLATMQHAGLDITDALTLASKCPWVDGDVSIKDLQVSVTPLPPPPRTPPQSQVQSPPQAQAQPEFVIAEGFDMPGGDYRIEKNLPADACRSLCQADNQCRAYTYNTTARWCFLKDRVSEAQPFTYAISGMKKSSPLTESTIGRWR
jgi:hypothetical protein